MATGEPWSRTGMDDDTSAAARFASRRSGSSMSLWVKKLLWPKVAVERVGCRGSASIHKNILTAKMVDDLSRQIENADETARSTVEGLDKRSTEAAPAMETRSASDAIQRLEGERRSVAKLADTRRDDVSNAGIEAIKARLKTLLAAAPASPSADLDATLALLEKHIEEARSRLSGKTADRGLCSPKDDFTGDQQSRGEQTDMQAIFHGQQKIAESVEKLHGSLAAIADRLSVFDAVDKPSTVGVDRFAAIEDEITAIRGALEGVDGRDCLARLEMRVAELARSTEAASVAAAAASRPAFAEVVGRIECRIDDALARLDRVLERSVSTDEFATMKADLGRLHDLLAERDPLAEIGRPVQELEEKVSRLTLNFERTAPRLASLESIEAKLQSFHEMVSDSRREAIDAAREVAERTGNRDLVGVFTQDLNEIRKIADAADARTQEALGAVQATLAKVVERLALLEGERDEEIGTSELLKATGTYGAASAASHDGLDFGVAEGRRTNVAASAGMNSASMESVRPDLAALRELARSVTDRDRKTSTDRRADFIAAARRAAQAAAERTVPPGGTFGRGKPETLIRIGRAISGRRRTLLAMAAISILTLSAAMVVEVTAKRSPSEKVHSTADLGARSRAPAVAGSDHVLARRSVHEFPRTAAEASSATNRIDFVFAAPEHLHRGFSDAPQAPPTRAFAREIHRSSFPPIDEAVGPLELRQAAAAGDPNAAITVAARYAEGRLVPRNLSTAAKWYEIAAEDGVAVAQYRLASLYERGDGVAKNPRIAADWYRRAAEQGNTGAMHNLGVMMSNGVDGTSDFGGAVKWFRAAADLGVVDSQYNLGVIYARGLGVQRNLAESYKWFALAATTGDPEAVARRDEIGDVLSPGDLARTRAAIGAWQRKPKSASANDVAILPEAWREPVTGITDVNRRSLVVKIQRLLAEQGYDPGPADGLEGPKTRQAVLAFQREFGLVETGTIGNELVTALADTSD